MTPEHVSELQNILRFLRANAFEKSEAALVDEVEGLMRAAQLEKDDAERRLEASASGNNDEADASLNREDPGSAREVSNDTFGPASPPAVPRPSLGRFGSDVERAHAAMALEDAFANEAAGKEAHADPSSRRLIHLDEDAESVGTLDTFATPIGDDDGDDASASISASEFAGQSISASEFASLAAAAPDAAAREEEKKNETAGARDDDSASASDADDAEVSFATMRTMPPRRDGSSDEDVPDDTNDDDDREGAPFFFERVSRVSRVEKTEARGVANAEDVEDSEDSEAFDRAARAWQTAPREEYADFEDPGYVRVRVPRGDEENALRGRRDCFGTARREVRPEEENDPDASNASLGESRNDRITGASSSASSEGDPSEGDGHRAGGFAFDRSPAGSERSGPLAGAPADVASKTDCPYTMDPRMGWGGSEFGGDSEPSRVSSPRDGRDADVETSHERPEKQTRIPAEVSSATNDDPESAFETFSLKIVHRASRTGFEAHKDFLVVPGELVAGRYRVRDVLGAAAFSVAVRAEDARTREEVCLKIVKNDKDFFDQSLDEVKLLKMMNDADARDEKNIVRMLDFFYHREHLFIVTELLGLNLYEHQKLCLRVRADARRASEPPSSFSKRALRDTLEGSDAGDDRSSSSFSERQSSLRESPYFSVKALRVVAKQVLVALEFMHARGVIHCDVKPENIVLRRGDANARRRRVKVIDLGSSCFTTDFLSTYVQSRSYRAPEVVLGAPYDGKADLWSLGCVLAELFTGQVLLRNESTPTALARVIGIFGPLDPELLRLGKHAGALVTAAGVPYERLDVGVGEDGGEDASDDGESGEERVRVLLPKRTSLAARLGLPPLGVACDARSPANGAARGLNPKPAPTALPAGFAAAFEAATLDTTSVGAADGADGPSGIDALDLGTTTVVSPEPIERVSTSSAFREKPRARDAWTATEEKDGFIEFLLLLLQPNPRRRPTAARALAHDWLAGDDDDDDFEDAWVPPQTASPYGDARERDILAQL